MSSIRRLTSHDGNRPAPADTGNADTRTDLEATATAAQVPSLAEQRSHRRYLRGLAADLRRGAA